MKTLLKIVGGLIALVLVLVIAGGAILGIFFDPNEYKGEIEKLALEQGGVELKIGGDIGWSVFPWLGLEVNQVSVRYPDKAALADLNKAQISVRIPALLSGQVQMSGVVVDGLKLNLEQDAQGNNWSTASSGQAQTDASPASNDTPAATAISVDIDSIVISNGSLTFSDKAAATRFLVSDLNLTTGKVRDDTVFPLSLSLQAKQFAADQQVLAVDTALESKVRFNLAKQQFWLQGFSSKTTATGDATGGKPITLALAADITADALKQAVALEKLQLALANLSLSGNLAVDNFSAPVLSGKLDIAPFELNKLLTTLGQPAVETSDASALKAIALSATLEGPANTVTASKLSLKLDDTTFNGDAAFDLASGAISLNLQGDSLNADRYMPPAAEQPAQQTTAQASGERYSKEPVIPVEPLKGLNLDATFGLSKLHVSNLDIQNIAVAVSAHNGLVKASKLNADLYQGTVRSDATLDLRKTPISLTINKKVQGIQVGEVLKAAAATDALSGDLSSQANLTARGDSVYAIVHSLNGTTQLQMKDGEIKGIDMAQTVCQGLNTVKSLGINTQEVDRSTPFANLSASTRIVNGVITNPDLKAALDAMALSGKGTVDLPQESLNYRVGLTIQENLFKQTCSIPDSLEGVEFPVDCKGGFDTDPAKLCKPDLAVFENIFKAKAKAKVKEKVDEQKEKLTEKLGEKLGGEEGAKQLLKGLFGR